jgi:hypothetical protein
MVAQPAIARAASTGGMCLLAHPDASVGVTFPPKWSARMAGTWVMGGGLFGGSGWRSPRVKVGLARQPERSPKGGAEAAQEIASSSVKAPS